MQRRSAPLHTAAISISAKIFTCLIFTSYAKARSTTQETDTGGAGGRLGGGCGGGGDGSDGPG